MIRVIVIDDNEQRTRSEWIDVEYLQQDPMNQMTFLSSCNVMIAKFIKEQVEKSGGEKP